MKTLLRTIIAISPVILLPAVVLAQGIDSTVNNVGGPWLPAAFTTSFGCTGNGCAMVNIITGVVSNLRPAVWGVAIFVITIAGFRLVITEEEESFSKSTKIISATISGVILSYLIEPFVNAVYGGLGGPTAGSILGGIGIGAVPQGNMATGAGILHTEILGLIRWILVIVGVFTVFIIIVSGIKAIVHAGSEEGLSGLRRTLFGVLSGVLVIAFSEAINATFGLSGVALPGAPTIAPAAAAAVKIMTFILGFMALIAVAVIVYAGFMMVLNFGSEENFRNAKNLIIRVALGLLVILVSLAVINFVVAAVTVMP